MARFQFSLVTAFSVVNTVAILCFLTGLEHAFPHWTLLPSAMLVCVCLVSRWRTSPDLAWGLFAIAWLLALIQLTRHLISAFAISGTPVASDLQRGFRNAYVSNLALPLYLSFPAAWYAIKGSRGSRSCSRKWIVVCSLVGVIDVTVLTVSLHALIEYVLPS